MRLSRQFSILPISERKFSFLTGPNKLAFVRMYGSAFTGLVGPLHFYRSLLAFHAFFCFFMYFMLFYTLLLAHKTLTSKN